MGKENTDYWNAFINWHIHHIKSKCVELCIPFKDYLEFPIEWDRSLSLEEYVLLIYENYVNELKEFNEIDCVDINKVQNICSKINNIFRSINSHRQNNITQLFEDLIEILGIKPKGINDNHSYYKLRGDKRDLISELDFYHVPFDSTYRCGTCRFSILGQPALYLGYSKQVCIAECGESFGTIAEFLIKEKSNLMVMDLTFNNQEDIKHDQMFYLWPFLAACYIEVPREVDEKLGCINYKAEYIFPQAFAAFLMSKDIRGVIYYTVRNQFLIPAKTENNNVVFFAKKDKPNTKYDLELMSKFKIDHFTNI